MKNSRKKEALVFLLAVRIERKDNDKTKAMPSILGKIDIYKVNIEMVTITMEENKAG